MTAEVAGRLGEETVETTKVTIQVTVEETIEETIEKTAETTVDHAEVLQNQRDLRSCRSKKLTLVCSPGVFVTLPINR